MNEIQDLIFGKMTYNHGWVKVQTLSFWNQSIDFRIKVPLYANKEINDTQRNNYQSLIDNLSVISVDTYEVVKKYIQSNVQLITPFLPMNPVLLPEKLVTPHTLLFFGDGTHGILFDCKWDIEHGLAVTLPDLQVGPQDILL